MPSHGRLLSFASILLLAAAGPAVAEEWHYLAPGDGEQNIHRAFAFAEENDDRLEFACTSERRDLFYSTSQTVSEADLERLKGSEPAILIRLDGVGVVPLDAGDAYQKGDRLYFVTAVAAPLITDLGKASEPVAAGMRADGEIVQQGTFPTGGLASAMQNLAAGCGF